jgi:hypothetical protein
VLPAVALQLVDVLLDLDGHGGVRVLDLSRLDETEVVRELVDLLVAASLHLFAVRELHPPKLLVGVAAGEEVALGKGILPEGHVGLTQTVVRERHQGVELDGGLEFQDRLLETLRGHRVLALPVMVQRLTLPLLFLARGLLRQGGTAGENQRRDDDELAHERKTAGGIGLPPASHLYRLRPRSRTSRRSAC